MIEYAYPDLWQNKPAIVLALYFEQRELALNKKLVALSEKIADWLNIEWHKFVVAFARDNLPLRNFYEYKRTHKRWTQLLNLMETEMPETFGMNNYDNGVGNKCVVTLNVDFRFKFDKPNTCYLRLLPDVFNPDCIDQANEGLLSLIAFAVEAFRPLYGFVHVGDLGLNWYLYANGTEDSSFPVEDSEVIDVFNSADTLRTRVPRIYWANLLGAGHVRKLGDIEELRAWELGSLEWQTYHHATLNEEFRQQKGLSSPQPGKRVDWPVLVHRIGEEHVYFSLTSNPLDWSPNIGIGGLIKAEYRRIVGVFKSKGLMA